MLKRTNHISFGGMTPAKAIVLLCAALCPSLSLSGCRSVALHAQMAQDSPTETSYLLKRLNADEDLIHFAASGKLDGVIIPFSVSAQDVYSVNINHFTRERIEILQDFLTSEGRIDPAKAPKVAAFFVISLNDVTAEALTPSLTRISGAAPSDQLLKRTMAGWGDAYAYTLRDKGGYTGIVYLAADQVYFKDEPDAFVGTEYYYDHYSPRRQHLVTESVRTEALPIVPPEFRDGRPSALTVPNLKLYQLKSETLGYITLYGFLGARTTQIGELTDLNSGTTYAWYPATFTPPVSVNVVFRSSKGILAR